MACQLRMNRDGEDMVEGLAKGARWKSDERFSRCADVAMPVLAAADATAAERPLPWA